MLKVEGFEGFAIGFGFEGSRRVVHDRVVGVVRFGLEASLFFFGLRANDPWAVWGLGCWGIFGLGEL